MIQNQFTQFYTLQARYLHLLHLMWIESFTFTRTQSVNKFPNYIYATCILKTIYMPNISIFTFLSEAS
jgi:hypothetical protein